MPSLVVLDGSVPHTFMPPSKRINEGEDMSSFWVSCAYSDIMTFLMQLNHSMFPQSIKTDTGETIIRKCELNEPSRQLSQPVKLLQELLSSLDRFNDEVELDTGPRRFGNVSFRKWFQMMESRVPELLVEKLPSLVTAFNHEPAVTAIDELKAYLIGSFGSSQRLDYGTGHELSFLAFLGCIWKLGGFGSSPGQDEARELVIGVVNPYLVLIRKLILRYTLEPAGTHGVWGLDDHSFLPYIFGSAQYGPAIKAEDAVPVEGSSRGAPEPGNIVKADVVERERTRNLYFGAIGFIYDVKTGPFWEHSPTLYDISGVRAGWGKINKGMLKMYDAEVLGKFPVVQHFPFGSLFSFERDPNAKAPAPTAHTSSQPPRRALGMSLQTPTYHGLTPAIAPSVRYDSREAGAIPGAEATVTSRAAPNTARHIPKAQGKLQRGYAGAAQPTSGSAVGGIPPPTKAPWAK